MGELNEDHRRNMGGPDLGGVQIWGSGGLDPGNGPKRHPLFGYQKIHFFSSGALIPSLKSTIFEK